jgi:hypothetical protein
VSVISVNRLKASYSDFAAHAETPAPGHNHEAQTSERTLTPARLQTRVDRHPRLKGRLTAPHVSGGPPVFITTGCRQLAAAYETVDFPVYKRP